MRVSPLDTARTLRTTNNALGDGFVEAVPNSPFAAIQANQPPAMAGPAEQLLFQGGRLLLGAQQIDGVLELGGTPDPS